MGLTATQKSKNNIPPLETGVYMASCVGIVDLGEQNDKKWNKIKEKVLYVFEVAGEFVEFDGEQKPRWQSISYTNSINEKANLYNAIKAWRSCDFSDKELEDGFDNSTMLGKSCQIQVFKESGKNGDYNYIQSVMGLPKGMPAAPLLSDTFLFNMDSDIETVKAVFETLPSWMQEKIKESNTWVMLNANAKELNVEVNTSTVEAPIADGDIPF